MFHKNFEGLFAVILLTLSCTQPKLAVRSPAAAIAVPIAKQTAAQQDESGTGILSFKVSAKDGGEIVAESNAYTSELFSQTKINVPPGSLSVDGEIELFEATPLVNSVITSSLKLTTATAAGPAIAIEAGTIAITTFLEIEIPYAKDGNFSLVQSEQFIVIGITKSNGEFEAETFIGDELTIGDHTIKLKITHFGAFQVAKVTEVPTKIKAPSLAGYTSRAVAEQSGASQYHTFYALNDAQLPDCDSSRTSQLFYVLGSQSFKSCNGQDWIVIVIQGPKGDTGAAGVNGIAGVAGVAGVAGATGAAGAAGVAGAKGDQGTTTPGVPAVSVVLDADQTVCTSVTENTKIINRCIRKYYDSYGGTLVRSCTSDSWHEPAMANGFYYYSKNYGDVGCLMETQRFSYCDAGYTKSTDKLSCVSNCTEQNHNSCTFAQCTDQGMTWVALIPASWSYCAGTCGGGNYGGCITSTQCSSVGGLWVGSSCEGCSSSNLGACSTQILCENSNLTWLNNACVGYCEYGNVRACTTIQSCNNVQRQWDVDHCVELCPQGKAASSRGCEMQTVSCSTAQRLEDNTCIDLVFTVATSPLSGVYDVPTRIAANAVITNTVAFNQELIVDPGVVLSFDGPHSFYANKSMIAEGTAEAPIVVKNDPSFDGHLNRMEIANTPCDYKSNCSDGLGNYNYGTKLSYVTIADNLTKDYTVTVTVAGSAAGKAINSFAVAGVDGIIDEPGKAIAVTVPDGTDLTGLVATFTHSGVVVNVGAIAQTSSVTQNNFVNPVVYRVNAADNSTADYTVRVTLASATKSITAFSISNYPGIINEALHTISVPVPYTDWNGLPTTFTQNGQSIKIGSVDQTSGVNENDFRTPLTYRVTAADSSYVDYTVTLTTPLSMNIGSFTLAGIQGDIDQEAGTIHVILPVDSDLSALSANIVYSGASIKVGQTEQINGTTVNNFSNPIVYHVRAVDDSSTAVALVLSGHYSHLVTSAARQIGFNYGVLQDSTISTANMTSQVSYGHGRTIVQKNLILNPPGATGNYLGYYGNISVFSNTIKGFYINLDTQDQGPLLFALNRLDWYYSMYCGNSPLIYMLGNALIGGPGPYGNCTKEQNGSTLPTSTVVFVSSPSEGQATAQNPFDAKAGDTVPFSALVIDPIDGLLTSGISPTWEAKYSLSGTPVFLDPPTGFNPNITFTVPESYQIGITGVGDRTIFGKTSATLGVGN